MPPMQLHLPLYCPFDNRKSQVFLMKYLPTQSHNRKKKSGKPNCSQLPKHLSGEQYIAYIQQKKDDKKREDEKKERKQNRELKKVEKEAQKKAKELARLQKAAEKQARQANRGGGGRGGRGRGG